jgi:hypothetical protein
MHLELTRHALALQADGSSSALAPRDAALLAWLALEGPTSRTHLADCGPERSRLGAHHLRQRFHLKNIAASWSRAVTSCAHGYRPAPCRLGRRPRRVSPMCLPSTPAARAARSRRRPTELEPRSADARGWRAAAALAVAEALRARRPERRPSPTDAPALPARRRAAALPPSTGANERSDDINPPVQRWRCCNDRRPAPLAAGPGFGFGAEASSPSAVRPS